MNRHPVSRPSGAPPGGEGWRGLPRIVRRAPRALAVLLASSFLALPGCVANDLPPAQRLLVLCEDYADAFDATVDQAELGAFSIAQLEAIQEAHEVPARICNGNLTTPEGRPLTLAGAISMVEQVYFELLAARRAEEIS